MFKQNFDLPDYFKVQRFCFAKIGIDLTAEKRIVANYCLNVIPQLCIVMFCFAISAYALKHPEDVVGATKALAAVLQFLLVICKWTTFMCRKREIVKLLHRMLAWNDEAIGVEHAVINAENRTDIRICKFYFLVFNFAFGIAFTMPLIVWLWHYVHGVNTDIEPPMAIIFPFDHRKSCYYMLLDIFEAICSYGMVFVSSGVDGLFSWFTRNIIAQFRILQLRLEQAGHENNGNVSIATLESCVKNHCRIFEIIEQLNIVYGIIIFVKFSNGCVQLCCVAFQLISPNSDIISNILFTLIVLLQLFLYCWNGQGLQDESLQIADCIYLSFKWENVGLRQRKMLFLLMLRAQRACGLSGVFFVVDYHLFLWVVRTAYSMVTLLQTMDN